MPTTSNWRQRPLKLKSQEEIEEIMHEERDNQNQNVAEPIPEEESPVKLTSENGLIWKMSRGPGC